MDSSRTCLDEGNCDVGSAVIIPSFKANYMFNLNNFSSSYTAEAMAILQALDLAMNEKWTSINICSDPLSLLKKLDLSRVFPFIKT